MGDDEEKFCIQTPNQYGEVLTECGNVVQLYEYEATDDCNNYGGRILEDSYSYGDSD